MKENPQHSIDAALAAIDKLHKDVSVLSDALAAHLRSGAGDPVVRGFLVRMDLLLGEFKRAAAGAP